MSKTATIAWPNRRWPPLLALGAAALLGSGLATPQRTIGSAREVGDGVASAASEVMLVTPFLRSKEVAESLRKVATQRGVRVYVLADVQYIQEGGSFLNGLSMVKGIQIRLLRGLKDSRATIDRKSTITGPLLADQASLLNPGMTTLIQEPRMVQAASAWFSRAWATATPYKYEVPPAPKSSASPAPK